MLMSRRAGKCDGITGRKARLMLRKMPRKATGWTEELLLVTRGGRVCWHL